MNSSEPIAAEKQGYVPKILLWMILAVLICTGLQADVSSVYDMFDEVGHGWAFRTEFLDPEEIASNPYEITERVLDNLQQGKGNGVPTASDPIATSVGEYTTIMRDLSLGGPMPLNFGRYYGVFVGIEAEFIGFYPGQFDSPMGAS